MPVSRRALLGILFAAPATLATACFDDEKLGDVQEPTSQPHFLLRLSGVAESDASDGSTDVEIAFLSPDRWEIKGPGTKAHPEHVILAGNRGWQQVRSVWTDYPDVDFLRTTLLSFAPALAEMNADLRSSGKGPRYEGEGSRIYRKTASSEDELIARVVRDTDLRAEAVATITTIYADLVTKVELHVGVDSKRVYFIRTTREGPNITSDAAWTFDYETPVSITLPS